jgi:glucokinase
MNILGVDIGGTKMAVCLGDEHGHIRASRRMPTGSESPDSVLQGVIEMARGLLRELALAPHALDAVGISAPGPLSVSKGLLLAPPNMPGWIEVPVVRMFAEAFDQPVFMNNDANAGALAEYLFGRHEGVRDLVYLTMSTGLGAGFVADGKVVQGATDLAGEVGHHVLVPDGPPCPCGQRGCWEIFCGGMNVAHRLRSKIKSSGISTAMVECAGGDAERIDFKAFVEAVRRRDPFALQEWEDYTEHLAHGIGTVIQFMNPSLIVLGTIGIHAADLILDPVRRKLPRYAWSYGREASRIEPSALGTRIGNLSALAVAIAGLGARD